jgi:large subunit ribosomal protein L25
MVIIRRIQYPKDHQRNVFVSGIQYPNENTGGYSMNESLKLKITKRLKGSKGAMNKLRRDGFLPGSISQKGGEAVSFSMKKEDFRKALKENGMSSIYKLQGEKRKTYSAMVREIQYVPGSTDFLHVTFQAVSLTEETTADIPVYIQGRDELLHHGHELMQLLETVHLKGLPGDFPSSIEIDVSNMEPGDQVTVADLEMPKGITCLTEEDRLVLSVPHPKLKEEESDEAEETAADETAEAAEGGEGAAE